ncbi:chorismate--pyruvate lyase family protein [Methanobrevibacter curvatus]|uniref:Chorismate pyruvate-lyase n=1 Tax=Methanobrevibacter curvatus TaxID=49547 RepID=A0A166E5B0_9EURY|nr:chorismate lyase [Methanobrevibacter curvatus]KZX16295.1 chorismate pyruvate-lyase [Methanobrevibacter curvatus]
MGKNEFNIMDEIKRIETEEVKLSNIQKILLATDGSVTTILDVLNGRISIKTLKQEYQEGNKEIAKILNINEGEKVNYRVVVMKKDKKPLIYAKSYIPLKRLSPEFKKDLISADIPIGRILKKYNIESRREVQSALIKKPNKELKEIFKTEADFLSRSYNIIHNNEILITIEEIFPLDSFINSYK